MNEFIVWNKNQKNFVNKDDYLLDLNDYSIIKIGNGYGGTEGNFTIDEDKNCKAFPYIGKTDDTPEQNKIYADCSIIEYVDCTTHYIGTVKYNSKYARYEFWHLEHPEIGGTELFYLRDKNFKIIDTIQENKLGLLSNKKI